MSIKERSNQPGRRLYHRKKAIDRFNANAKVYKISETGHRIVMVDPPSGWKYGFPKPLPKGVDYREWLLEQGYPEADIELAMKYSKCWEETVCDRATCKYTPITYKYTPIKENLIFCSPIVVDWLNDEYIEDEDWHKKPKKVDDLMKEFYKCGDQWYYIRVPDRILSFIMLKFNNRSQGEVSPKGMHYKLISEDFTLFQIVQHSEYVKFKHMIGDDLPTVG